MDLESEHGWKKTKDSKLFPWNYSEILPLNERTDDIKRKREEEKLRIENEKKEAEERRKNEEKKKKARERNEQ
jgi:hypothetical protein